MKKLHCCRSVGCCLSCNISTVFWSLYRRVVSNVCLVGYLRQFLYFCRAADMHGRRLGRVCRGGGCAVCYLPRVFITLFDFINNCEIRSYASHWITGMASGSVSRKSCLPRACRCCICFFCVLSNANIHSWDPLCGRRTEYTRGYLFRKSSRLSHRAISYVLEATKEVENEAITQN